MLPLARLPQLSLLARPHCRPVAPCCCRRSSLATLTRRATAACCCAESSTGSWVVKLSKWGCRVCCNGLAAAAWGCCCCCDARRSAKIVLRCCLAATRVVAASAYAGSGGGALWGARSAVLRRAAALLPLQGCCWCPQLLLDCRIFAHSTKARGLQSVRSAPAAAERRELCRRLGGRLGQRGGPSNKRLRAHLRSEAFVPCKSSVVACACFCLICICIGPAKMDSCSSVDSMLDAFLQSNSQDSSKRPETIQHDEDAEIIEPYEQASVRP
jgi:hypothetical protein